MTETWCSFYRFYHFEWHPPLVNVIIIIFQWHGKWWIQCLYDWWGSKYSSIAISCNGICSCSEDMHRPYLSMPPKANCWIWVFLVSWLSFINELTYSNEKDTLSTTTKKFKRTWKDGLPTGRYELRSVLLLGSYYLWWWLVMLFRIWSPLGLVSGWCSFDFVFVCGDNVCFILLCGVVWKTQGLT